MHSVHLPLVLFLCRTNATCSIMAEAILRHLAQEWVRTASGGEVPHWEVNPLALECLRTHGIATQGLRCKRWGEFFGLNRPSVRFVIALRDVYATRANWPHDTLIVRWHMPDPGAAVGSEIDIRAAFEEAFRTLRTRIDKFLALPFDQLHDQALFQELTWIGKLTSEGIGIHAM